MLFVICIVVDEHLYCNVKPIFLCLEFFVFYCFLCLWFCLVFVGIRWMPWHSELMKDVAVCDMP